MQSRKKKVEQAAEEIARAHKASRLITLTAAKTATERMLDLINNEDWHIMEGKARLLKENARNLGAAAGFRKSILDKARRMPTELQAIGNDEGEAQIMADLWLGFVLEEVSKHLANPAE